MPRDRRWILYVEDDEDQLVIVRRILPRAEFPVTWAATAAEARTRLRETRFDLVILDHGLPDTNGLLLLEEIKRDYPGLPVVMLTHRADEALEVSACQKGAAGFLMKEKSLECLRCVVEKALQPSVGEADRRGAAEREERLSRILIETMSEGVLIIDADGILTFANAAAGMMIDVPAEALTGRSFKVVFDEPTAARLAEFYRTAASGEDTGPKHAAFEGRLRPAVPGVSEGLPVIVSIHDLRGRLGSHETLIVSLTDIESLVHVQRSLHARLAELERFQRLFIGREMRIVELKERLRDYERRLGIESPGLSDATRRALDDRIHQMRRAAK